MMGALEKIFDVLGASSVRPEEYAMRKLFSLCLAAVLTVALAPLHALAATDVTGTWTGSVQMGDAGGGGAMQLTFTFKQDGSALTGNVNGGQGDPLAISNGKVDGDKISFTIDFNGTTITHEGTVSGDQITLNSKSSDGNFPAMTLTLKRAKAGAAQ
jgi:hypothetical protein